MNADEQLQTAKVWAADCRMTIGLATATKLAPLHSHGNTEPNERFQNSIPPPGAFLGVYMALICFPTARLDQMLDQTKDKVTKKPTGSWLG